MKYLFLNHKMNLTLPEMEEYQRTFPNPKETITVAVFPTYLNIPVFSHDHVSLGSQDVSSLDLGAHTGEVSAKQLKSFGVSYSLVGHSERREKDTFIEIHDKIQRLQEVGIIPVLCVGEKDKTVREEVLKEQLSTAIDSSVSSLIIAYEPVYSIGTGVVLENAEIEKAIAFIRNFLETNFQKSFPVLYGGSVDEQNIGILNQISNIDGFLVGKASLDVRKIEKMMEEVQ